METEKICSDCGDCDRCDLDKTKICDDCCRCLGDSDYRGIEVTEIIMPDSIKLKRKKSSGR